MKKNEPGSQTFETILERRRKKRLRFVAVLGAILIFGGGILFMLSRETPKTPPNPPAERIEWKPAAVIPPPPMAEEIEEVIVVERSVPAPAPLAELDQSDAEVRLVAYQLSSHRAWIDFLVGESLVRRFVAIVDNIAQGSIPTRLLFALRPDGAYRATRDGETLEVDPASWERYDTLGRVASEIDARATAAFFETWRPRIDQAYRELGYPDQTFSETLMAAFQELLAAPAVEGLPALVPEGLGYAYADPELENLSSAQKQLLRMGPENMERVQEKLREIARHLGFSASQLPRKTLYLTPPRD
ncbi:MAG: DUF3014 domain-containing protein [Myxococcota bacterium]|nr:DUF3014 domain-containing protein [Myxococcota bacterium]